MKEDVSELTNSDQATRPTLLLLNPANQAFVEGQTRTIKQPLRTFILHDMIWYFIPIFLILAGCYSIFVEDLDEDIDQEGYRTVFFGLIGLSLAEFSFGKIQAINKYRNLSKNGQFLIGKLVGCESKYFRRSPKGTVPTHWKVRLDYHFRSPEGISIEGTKKFRSADSYDWLYAALRENVSVAVIYINPDVHDIL